ncbi:DoxX-like family protein [Comamonas thiooxydans]|uniref:DoxX-like family protein n=1 Tax=Comamonas thiooxydans TaxID=363952 RepID=UPI0005F82FB9|nr:DoxX-like family protein [Comamonas thiooxydans]MCO8251706.1 DoxX-like family protein [Comamonas thiooxydans]UBQ40284.1 DoxX-like family protein [Comamonas thiooxydans]CUB01922.1 DoxX-like family [Comamonas thiooxydans]
MPELQNGSRTNPQKQAARFMHASLVVVWLGTALVSALDYFGLSGLNHEGARLLDQGGIGDARWQALLIWSGLLADLALGLALLLRPGRAIYLSALLLMTAMTVIGTALQPTLWLHPLGPLLKNLPIAAMLWFLLQTDHSYNRLES